MFHSSTATVLLMLALAAAGCTGATPEAAPPGPPAPSGPSAHPSAAPEPPRSFAESLETLTFTYDAAARRLELSFTRLSPEPEQGPRFEAVLAAGETGATLGSSDPRGYEASAECADELCSRATIRISKRQGPLAGRVVVQRESRRIARTFQRGTPLGTRVTSSDGLTSSLAEFLSRENLTWEASLSVLKLEDGSRGWFEMHYVFLPTPIMSQGQLGYYDDKELVILGQLGQKSPVTVARRIFREGAESPTRASARATATLTESAFTLRFERPALGNPTLGMELD
ncbi:MAG TPA: hypothetical protein VM598_07900 [Bdellovibrionota bacterium]|nr:hypothetical protein [Bdellovibrionota bacterium]